MLTTIATIAAVCTIFGAMIALMLLVIYKF